MSDYNTPEIKPDINVKNEPQVKTLRTSPVKPGKRTPAKQFLNSAKKQGFNPTTKAMACDWVMKALDNMSAGMKKELAEELGVKQANLINSWNNNWKKRVEKVLQDEFRGST